MQQLLARVTEANLEGADSHRRACRQVVYDCQCHPGESDCADDVALADDLLICCDIKECALTRYRREEYERHLIILSTLFNTNAAFGEKYGQYLVIFFTVRSTMSFHTVKECL